MKEKYFLTKQIEIETDIEIVKEDTLYFAYVRADGYDEKKVHCWIDKNNQIDVDECDTEEEWDCIYNLFVKYVEENGIKYFRKCDKCGNGMKTGYVIQGGEEYYCSSKCLHEVYTPKEWQEMYEADDNNNSDNYWTKWEDESQFILFDNQLIEI